LKNPEVFYKTIKQKRKVGNMEIAIFHFCFSVLLFFAALLLDSLFSIISTKVFIRGK